MEVIDNICIPDSHEISKRDFDRILDEIETERPSEVMKNRSRKSLKAEWAAHNGLYKLGMWKSHTKDTDLEYPQKWYLSVAYYIFGNLFRLIIK